MVPVTSTPTSYSSGGKTIPCELYTPVTPNGCVIIIAYGSDGMIDNQHGKWKTMLHDYASELSTKGVTALIPDYFERTGTAAGSIDYERGGGQIVLMNLSNWQGALNDSVAHARTLTRVDPKRVGLLGFSLGGHLCLRLRSTAKAVVEYFAPYAGGIGDAAPSVPVQIHHGKIDPVTGAGDHVVRFDENAIPIVQTLKRQGASVDLHEYVGAGHGFVGTDPANQNAATQSKARMIAFFGSHL